MRPGAKIEDLEAETLDRIGRVDSNHLIVVKIAAGINNFTNKSKNKYHEYEITVKNIPAPTVFWKLTHFKLEIKKLHQKSIVTYCTIPPAYLVHTQRHAIERKKLLHPSYSEKQLSEQTDFLVQSIVQINQAINESNTLMQLNIIPKTVSLHNECLKTKPNGKLNRLVSRLTDGIHGTERTQRTWFRKINEAVNKEINLYTSNH